MGRESSPRTVAVLLAGGTGSRVGLSVPKQLIKVAGKTILEHTLDVFQRAPEIDQIIVMMTPGFTDDVERLVEAGRYGKVSDVLEGGSTRSESTARALAALGDEDGLVLFHDAVRPLVSGRIVRECVNALRQYDAVDVAIASADTVIEVDGDVITSIPDRSRLRRGQTPQGFRLSTIRRAYALAEQDPHFAATDDCGVVLRYLPDVPIKVVEGSEQNMKVTHPVDLFVADKLFQLASTPLQRSLKREHYVEELRGRTAVIFGGGYGIGGDLAELLRQLGADVFAFSRTLTGTHVERAADVAAALSTVQQQTGRIDFVVNTAGVLHTGSLADTDDATLDEAIGVNYVAPVLIARESAAYLRQTKGHLLLFTSSSYTRGRAGYSLYSSCKAAVVNLTQALADEWAPLGVRVSCINPERTATPMRTRAFGDEPADTLLSSRVVALTSLNVLLSDVTGQVFDVRRVDPMSGTGAGDDRDEAEQIARSLVEVELYGEVTAAYDHAG